MKRKLFFISLLIIFIIELFFCFILFRPKTEFLQDSVLVNEVVHSISEDWTQMDLHQNHSQFDYVVLDSKGDVIYRTKLGLSENLNSAIIHRDTILDIEQSGIVLGKVIIYNDSLKVIPSYEQRSFYILIISLCIQLFLCIGYYTYLYIRIIKPFQHLKHFAERIAGGNLDIPLKMDRYNLFGAFTESFDIMRHELKKSRIAEAQANESKKELVAKLSHDIKTPLASIKVVSEVGSMTAYCSKDKERYQQIIGKADQIDTLVSNLFSATLEELEQLTVTPINIESTCLKLMLEEADYLSLATIPEIPQCLLYVDKLRLQQVFDNIFSNSYKYAGTKILVSVLYLEETLQIIIEDFGGGVMPDELPTIKEKYKRGKHTKDIEGAGLGLYISDYFMKEMQGALDVENGEYGLKVILTILLSGAI